MNASRAGEPAGAAPVELVIHVGDGKTGTSAIQRLLKEHKAQLAAGRTRYLGLMLEFATRKYPWQRAGQIETFHSLPPERAVAELSDVLAATVAEAARDGIERLVWSNETLLGRGATTIAALRGLPAGMVDVTVVAYVRRPDRWARSAYVQWGVKHKTYPGKLKDFPRWMAKRRIGVAHKLRAWKEAYGDRTHVRNYDAIEDVTVDFVSLIGLDPDAFASVRRNLPSPPAELALRAAFNNRLQGGVAPRRFTELLQSESVDFSLPLGRWVRGLMPDGAALDAVRARCADDIREVDAILEASGQPPFDDVPATVAPFSLDSDEVMTALLQMIAIQAEKLEQLEARVAALAAPAPAQASGSDDPVSTPKAAPAVGMPAGDPTPAVVAALAPGMGYFGAHAADCLRIPLQEPITALRLSLAESKPVFLNLRGLELRKDGKPVELPDDAWQATQSSTSGATAENGAGNLLRLKGIHSSSEPAPWWEVRFARPVHADELRITNRSDGWGSRSRTLRVDATDAAGSVRCLFDAQAPALLAASLAEAARLAGTAAPSTWPVDAVAAARLREALLNAIAERLATRALPLAGVAWPALLRLVDVWHRQSEPLPAEWTLLAAFLLHQHQGKGGTSIKAFSLLLDSRERLVRLQAEINSLGTAFGLGRFMLTRHGVKAEGVLRRDPQRFLSHLKAVVAALDALGREPVLAYGTLLGAVRDGDFIAHDDDVDLLYRSRGRNRAEVEADLLGLKETLRGQGFRVVDLLPNSLNLHVIDPRNSAVMDVFPCWEEDGKDQLHMESMRVRGLAPGILHPASALDFLGCRLPVPARPDAFLRERYGEGWTVSDQFYEWPWTLKEEADA